MNQLLSFVIFMRVAAAIVVVHPEPSGQDAGYDVMRAADIAHQKMKDISGLCAVLVSGDDGSVYSFGSGVFISRRHDVGYVLTSAGIVDHANPDRLRILFSGREDRGVRVLRIHVHPQFDASMLPPRYNIAILEFRFSDEELEPVSLDVRTHYETGEFIEGVIAGYGSFGTNRSTLCNLRRVHGGQTWVRLVSEGASQAFSSAVPHMVNRFDMPYELNQHFDVQAPVYRDPDLVSHIARVFRTHPDQSMPMRGDGGGPLFFKSATGEIKVAGINSLSAMMRFVSDSSGETAHFLESRWEPVFLSTEWIANVLAAHLE